ncbi:hypothetical protein ACFLRB_01345 [Acidobacteriota bacterium]
MKSEDQLEKHLEALISCAADLKRRMNAIKTFDRFDVTEVAKKTGRISVLRKTAKEFIDFVEFPEQQREPGRPVKYPDSEQEKKILAGYIKEGLSIRKIAVKTGISKDVISAKLKRYGIK